MKLFGIQAKSPGYLSNAPLLAMTAMLSCVAMHAQSAPVAAAASSQHTGCVSSQDNAAGGLVVSDGESCSLLAGKLATQRLNGHTVTLNGTTSAATAADPQTLHIDSVDSVGGMCHETCELKPPGARGIHKKAHPGRPGGTGG